MKLLFILLVFASSACHAQTWEEWTQQKKTKIKRLVEQIAAFKVYISYAKQGYTIANKGLTTIRTIKQGDFHIHRDFISSFSQVNPAVKGYAKAADIISYQLRIIATVKECLRGVKEANQFIPGELEYCSMVMDNLLTASLENIDELLLLVTAGKLSMKDDERLQRIDVLYTDMQDKYSFISSFSEGMALLTVQRMREIKEVNISKTLNGLQ